MFCQYCGTENAEGTKFCTNCGANLEVAATQNTYEQPTQAQPEMNQANYNQYATYAPAPTEDGKGFAIAGLVCGIMSFFCFGIICGILGIVFGCVARSKGYKKGMSTAAIVCGAIGLVLTILGTVGSLLLLGI